jgi:Sulfotransferase family
VQDDHHNLRRQWQPPPRPEWVQRINEEGRCMDIRAVVPLDENSLLDAAMRSTGLQDFGSEEWREPFRVFIKAAEEEGELNLLGRIRTRSELLQLLTARLRIEDTYKRHPEIADEQIRQPIIIIGQGRSGTSFLINLLAADPNNGAPMQWEAMFPCPPPERATYHSDPRIAQADALIKQWIRVTPTLVQMHEFAGDLPLEDNQILGLSFMSPTWFGGQAQAPSYDAYMLKQDMMPALRYHQRVLKLLQWKNPRTHWVLKDPTHLDRMQQLLQLYPDACFVWPHRDPIRALASMISLVGTLQWGRSDNPLKGGTYEYLINPEFSAGRLNAVIDQLESGAVPPRRICNLLYKDLVGDTLAALESMYAHFGIPFTEEGKRAVRQYLREHPREARPPHQLDMDPASLEQARRAYQRYQDYFGIPSE